MSSQARTVVGHSNVKVNPVPPKWFLDECFEYFPETGELRWRKRPLSHFVDDVAMRKWNTRWAGTATKTLGNGDHIIVQVIFEGKRFRPQITRVIFAMLQRTVPDGQLIDHIDRNPLNNRISNLRPITPQQSAFNSETKPRTRNHGLPRGVYPQFGCINRWQAKIRHNYKEICLGTFGSPEEAHAAYAAKARELRGEFAVTE